ncbi:MAG TPA: nuclear transport factor 2 family protein [candidate division Zixibacteria bacterium]|nr:nuclear transport factor 2 family protein [candidate division Zixibacteria bacterium]
MNVLLLAAAAIMICSAGAIAGTDPGGENADRAALAKIRSLYEEVVKSDDLTRLMPHLAPDVSAVTPTGEEVKTPQELQAYFKKIWGMIGKGGSYEVKVHLTRTDLYGDIAVSHGTTDELIRPASGGEYRFPMLWTAVSRRDSDGWKVIRLHGSIDPLANVFVQAQLEAVKWAYGSGGLIAGIALGMTVCFVWRRSRRRASSVA